MVAATAPEVDLEDDEGEIARPLFTRAEDTTDEGLDAMDWGVDDGNVEQVPAAVQKPTRSQRRKRRAEAKAAEETIAEDQD